MEENNPRVPYYSFIFLIALSLGGIWVAPVTIITKLFIGLGVVLVLFRRFIIPNTWNTLSTTVEVATYFVAALSLPGIWSIITIVSLLYRYMSMFKPDQIKPRLIEKQLISPYVGVAIVFFKCILIILDIDYSLIKEANLSPALRGMLSLFLAATVLSYLLQNRENVYDSLIKDLAVREKNWTLELMSLLSHNIRTPITAISNRIEIMRLKKSTNQPVLPEDIESLHQSNEVVSTIVNQLLSRTARTQLRDKEGVINLAEVLEMMELKNVVIENPKGVDFNLASTNAIALQLCIESLVSNSFKYGGKEVVLTIKSNFQEFMITISDDGRGMTKEQQEHYGTPFNISETSGGTGLGVYFTLQLIKEKGWNWSLSSTEGIGTSVTLIIPRRKLLF